jgi:hypothetical protein
MRYASLPQKIRPAEVLRFSLIIVADFTAQTASEQPPYLCQGSGLRTSLEFTSDLVQVLQKYTSELVLQTFLE